MTGSGFSTQLISTQTTVLSGGPAPNRREQVQKRTYLVTGVLGGTVNLSATLDIYFDELRNCNYGCNGLGAQRRVDLSNTVSLGGLRSTSGQPATTSSSSGYNFATPVPVYSVIPIPAAAWLFGGALGLLGVVGRRRAGGVPTKVVRG